MNRTGRDTEHGQAIVLLVLAMVVLLGFTALAVDGSMVYSDRRYSQNAADAASLAGGSVAAKQMEDQGVTYNNWAASPPNCLGKVDAAGKAGRASAVKRAKDNGFVISANIVNDNMGVVSECGMEPIEKIMANGDPVKVFDDKYMDMRTLITSETRTAFAHFVFSGPMRNTVTAITRVRPRQPLAYGFAIVALNPATDNCNSNVDGVGYHGLGGNSGSLTVTGGGVWSNGCMDADGNVTVEVKNGPVVYFNTANNYNLDALTVDSGEPSQLADDPANRLPPEAYDLPAPNCSGHEVTSEYITTYMAKNVDPVTGQGKPLPTGLYCVTDDLVINGGERVEGYGVTLMLYKGMTINGNPTVRLTAPPSNYVGSALAGVLIYATKSNQSQIKLNGDSNSFFQGTVLTPGASIDMSGNADLKFESQVIGWNVAVGGSTGTNVTYENKNQTSKPTTIDLYR